MPNEFHAAHFCMLRLDDFDMLELDYCEDINGERVEIAIEESK